MVGVVNEVVTVKGELDLKGRLLHGLHGKVVNRVEREHARTVEQLVGLNGLCRPNRGWADLISSYSHLFLLVTVTAVDVINGIQRQDYEFVPFGIIQGSGFGDIDSDDSCSRRAVSIEQSRLGVLNQGSPAIVLAEEAFLVG